MVTSKAAARTARSKVAVAFSAAAATVDSLAFSKPVHDSGTKIDDLFSVYQGPVDLMFGMME